jgi:hypothetical protein
MQVAAVLCLNHRRQHPGYAHKAMDSKKTGRKANLKQYRPINGKWQFMPLVKAIGMTNPGAVARRQLPSLALP